MAKTYEIFMLILILISVAIPFSDAAFSGQIDLLIWMVFVLDYFVRLLKAQEKKKFVKSHVIDLIAIIPLDSLFLSLRIVQVFRVFRLSVYAYRYVKPLLTVLRMNELSKVLVFAFVTIIAGAAIIDLVEPEIQSIEDGLWWAIVTATTVGYGDISPKTGPGRMVAVVLMLVGIGTMGIITGTIATYFLTQKEHDVPNSVKHIQQELARFHDLSETDLKMLIRYMEALLEYKRGHREDPGIPDAELLQEEAEK
ncbi:potassium channel family protein [Effusibacillus lacus]|nr:potassium channel family protein [Effusibacillus lacus]TCS71834.1 voltage-gated potassium channel [Effusibacillus lacus]